MPTISAKTVKAAKRPTLKSRLALQREQVVFYGVVLGAVLTLLIHFWVQMGITLSARGEREQFLRGMMALREMEVMEKELQFAEELKIVEQARTENRAALHRAAEFERRMNYDPAFARSETEKMLLEMKKLGENTELPREEALTRLVKLAVPPNSGMAVRPDGNGRRVEVAISHKQIAEQVTKNLGPSLETVYYEAQMKAAGIIKDILTLGAPLGVTRVTVRCQIKVTLKSGTEEKSEIRDLLVVSAEARDADWKQLTLAEVTEHWKKEKDEYPALLRGQ